MNKNLNFSLQFIVWIIVMMVPVYTCASTMNKIVKTGVHTQVHAETIQIQMTQPPKFRAIEKQNPYRLVLYIDGIFLPESTGKGESRIDRFKISQNTRQQTRVVIALDDASAYNTDITQLKNGRYSLNIHIAQPASVAGLSKLVSTPEKTEPKVSAERETQHEMTTVQVEKTDTTAAATEETTVVGLQKSNLEDEIFGSADDQEAEKEKDWKFSGSFRVRASLDTSDDKDNEHSTSLKNRIILGTEYNKKLKLSAISDFLYFGTDNDTDDYDLDLFEAYFKHRTAHFDVTVGKQIRRWGKADQISPVDTLNPENLTEFFIPSYEERKIPVWMVDVVYKKDNFFVEGVFIPVFEPAKFDYFGTDWALFSHLKDDINDSGLPSTVTSYFDGIGVNEDEPDSGTDGFEYAARIGGTINKVDFAFSYHYSIEDMPYFKSFPVKNLTLDNPNSVDDLIANLGSLTLADEQIETEYLKSHIVGFEFETTWDKIGLRGEAAYNENVSLLTSSFTSVRNPMLFWILGMDYTSFNQWYFNLQLGHQHIYDHDDSILYFEEDNISFIGRIEKDILQDKLRGAVEYTYMINDSSYYVSPRVIYSDIDNLELIFGFNVLGGDDDTIFGRYDENDQVFIDILYQF